MTSLLEAIRGFRSKHGSFLNYAWRIPRLRIASRWTLHNAFGVDAAQGVCRGRCTPDVTLSFIHYIRKLTLHHMAYEHQPHYATPLYHSLTHPNQTIPNQLLQQPKSTHIRSLLSAYMHPADLLCMLSAYVTLTFTSMCPLFVCRFIA